MAEDLMQKIVSLCKRRGFVFPNSEIYGGIAGFYDYGPLGVELKNNIKREWWQEMVWLRDDVVGIDGAIITHPRVWEASGHVEGFTDPLVECKKCHKRFRADNLAEELGKKIEGEEKDLIKSLTKVLSGVKCLECGGELSKPKKFNLMVEVGLGVIEGEKAKTYLKGEACQTIYLDYQNVLNSTRMKIPFGIAQIGKAFRNEITPKNFLFRQREFEQWDLQWFTHPKEMEKWFAYWKEERMRWYKSLINHQEKIRLRQHEENELAHYAKVAFDIEYETPFGWKEWEGIHWRGDWDLRRHGEFSGNDFTYTDPQTSEKFLPWIVETSGGVDRTFLFLLLDAYRKEGERVILSLSPRIAPFKVAVFPLLANKPELVEKAKGIRENLKKQLGIKIAWDDRGNIGKRYYSQDEIGTPYCVTVDFETLEKDDVTIRDRDSAKQIRVPATELPEKLKRLLDREVKFE